MTQCLDSGRSTYGISKNSGWGNGDLETFLKKFVAEAQYAKRVKKPFVFSFMIPEGGHSVVVCGYRRTRMEIMRLRSMMKILITLEVTGE